MTLSKAIVNDFKRCECCGGKKNLLALGGLIKKCVVCKGVGHVSTKEAIDKSAVESKSVVKRVRTQKNKGFASDKVDKRSKEYRDSFKAAQVPVTVETDSHGNLDLFDKTA
jgi:hypothetical protein